MKKGYVEGYYGKLFSFNDRLKLLDDLGEYGLDTYFYCPKEDPNHRLDWQSGYSEAWMNHFKELSSNARSKNIEFIMGISPGINLDIDKLTHIIKSFISIGITSIGILFDDLENNPKAEIQCECINKIAEIDPNLNLYFVPFVYCDHQLNKDNASKNYISYLADNLNQKVNIFWTGPKVVSDKYKETDIKRWKAMLNHNLYIWDNFFANDYCMPKIIIDDFNHLNPIKKADGLSGILMNGTGIYNIDKLLQEIFFQYMQNDNFDYKKLLLEKGFGLDSIYSLLKFEIKLKDIENLNNDLNNYLWKTNSYIKNDIYGHLHFLNFIHKNKISDKKILKRFNIV